MEGGLANLVVAPGPDVHPERMESGLANPVSRAGG